MEGVEGVERAGSEDTGSEEAVEKVEGSWKEVEG